MTCIQDSIQRKQQRKLGTEVACGRTLEESVVIRSVLLITRVKECHFSSVTCPYKVLTERITTDSSNVRLLASK